MGEAKPIKPRVADVAREAGVPETAVSFAYHDPQRLAPQTLRHILDTAKRLGYTPNYQGQDRLLIRSSGVIGILVPESIASVYGNPFYTSFFEGVGQVCDPNGLSMQIISPIAGSLGRAITNAQIDGLLVVGIEEQREDLDIVRKRHIPYVIVDEDALHVPSVNVNDEYGAWQAADYLLRLGHRRILCMDFEKDQTVGIPPVHGVHQRRLDGFHRAFTEHGIDLSSDYIIGTPTTVSGGMERFVAYWDRTDPDQRPTAVLTVSDAIALGVLDGARRRNLCIPRDLSIIGYDDIPMAALTQPTLTTIRQPVTEKGEVAAQLLLDWIGGAIKVPQPIMLSTELVVRQSASSPNAAFHDHQDAPVKPASEITS